MVILSNFSNFDRCQGWLNGFASRRSGCDIQALGHNVTFQCFFDDICYYVDAIDDIVFDFVQETWMKDEFPELLKDEPLNELVASVEEDLH